MLHTQTNVSTGQCLIMGNYIMEPSPEWNAHTWLLNSMNWLMPWRWWDKFSRSKLPQPYVTIYIQLWILFLNTHVLESIHHHTICASLTFQFLLRISHQFSLKKTLADLNTFWIYPWQLYEKSKLKNKQKNLLFIQDEWTWNPFAPQNSPGLIPGSN